MRIGASISALLGHSSKSATTNDLAAAGELDRRRTIGTASIVAASAPNDTKLPSIDLATQHHLRRRLNLAQKASHYFFIDVVGTCNLRCPSCPVGNSPNAFPKGLMPVENFRATLEKIRKDNQDKGRLHVDLYNWGDPSLHPELPALVKLVHEFDMGCGLSSNLNVFPHMREVIKENPDYLRISLSGYFNDVYQKTHRQGDVNAVKANMYLLRHLLDRYRSTTIVQVGFHIYRSNFPRDFLKIRELCDELGFIFDPVIATLMPAEKAVAAVDSIVANSDRDLVDNLVISVQQWRDFYEAEGIRLPDCQYRKDRTTINFDGTVSLCCAVFDPDKLIAEDFLALPRAELQRRKYGQAFCTTCMSHGMHQLFTGVPTKGAVEQAHSVLGPIYGAFEAENKMIGNPDYVVLHNAFRRLDDVYHAGLAALKSRRRRSR